MEDDSRQRLGELAVELDDLLGLLGRQDSRADIDSREGVDGRTEMERLIGLADGLTGVLMHEVACAHRAADGPT